MDFQKLPIDIRFDKPGVYFLWSTGEGSIVVRLNQCENEDELEAEIERAFTVNENSLKDRIANGDRLIAKRKGIIKHASYA